MSSYLDKLNTLPAEIIQDFRLRKKSEAIPVDLQQFIIDIENVIKIKETNRFDNIARISRELVKINPQLSLRTAKTRVYDAYSFFYVNDTIANEVWDGIYADKLEDLAQLLVAKGKEEQAGKLLIQAHKYRTMREKGIRPEDLKKPIFIINNKIDTGQLGFKDKSLKEIARKEKEGQYARLIDSLPASQKDKKRLYSDAEIQEAEVFEDENE